MTRSRGVLLAAVLLLAGTPLLAGDWPQFRGPDGSGIAAGGRLPLTWSEDEHVRWKVAIHGRGWSSPVVLGNRVWLTTATEDGRELFVVAVDRDRGTIVLDRKLFDVAEPQDIHRFNSYASPTPVAEPGLVCVTFGSPGTACLDPETGQALWSRRDLECNHYRGAGSSPIFFENLLILHFDGSDQQYVTALDKQTGRTVWTRQRSIDFQDLGPDGKPEAEGDLRKAFATPHVVTAGGRPVLVSMGAKATYGYDPRTGEELWRIEERTSHSASTRPVTGHGMVFLPTGFPRGQLLAVRADGRGDATGSHVVWRLTRGVPSKPSLLLMDDLIFMINDAGIASAVEARSGEVVWTARVGGNFSASPLGAGGRVYFFSEDGKTTVIAAAREFRTLAENHLDAGFMASPAADGNALFLRTRTHLYRIEE